MTEDRPWQNWDKGDVSLAIDAYWHEAPNENEARVMVAQDLRGKLVSGDVLEVGCGSGRIYKALKDAGILEGHTYWGGDVTPQMIALARNRYRDVKWRKLDIYNLGAITADNVLCIHVLQHLPDYKPPLNELLRVARGFLYIVSWFGLEDQIKIIHDSAFAEGYGFYQNTYSLPDFIAYLKSQDRVADVSETYMGGIVHAVAVRMVPG